MGRAEDRKAIVAEINQAAKLYRGFLVGKSFMYVFDDRYIEVIYKAENFKHLTGVDSHCRLSSFSNWHPEENLLRRRSTFRIAIPTLCVAEKSTILFSLPLLQPPRALCSKTYQQNRSAISLEQQT